MLVRNLDFRSLYMLYKFLTNFDKETKRWFHHPFVYPPYKNLLSLMNYMRLFLSMLIPRHILLKIFPRLSCIVVTAKLKHTVQGCAYLTIKRSLTKCYESELGIVVGKEFREKGIGNALLKTLIDEAIRIGVIKITLVVLKENTAAINLYKKQGFKIVKETTDSFNGKILDALIMELNLAPVRPMSHVIVSQGYQEFIGEYRMQAWVENVNMILKDEGYKVRVFMSGENRRSFAKNGVEVMISKRLGVLRDPFSLDIPAKILLTKKPSIVIIHGLQHLLTLFSLIIYFLRGVPVIIIVHGLYLLNSRLSSFRDRVLKFILHVFRNSYLLIALTDYDRQLLLKEWGIPEDKIRLTKVPLYINQEELQLIEQIKKKNYEYIVDASDKIRFLYIGRLDYYQKRVDRIIKIFYRFLKMSKSKHPNVELIIVGRGPFEELLVKMVKKLGIQDYVKIVGAVSQEEKWLHYLTSTVLVLASKFEGVPRVIFEAFATGKIVVAPNICGLTEVIQNGINGFLFDDDEEFLKILNLVVANSQSISAMQNTNRRLIIEKFNLEANKEEICSLLRDVQIKHKTTRGLL